MSARIIYLHGFRSSPHSFKARWLADHLRARGLGERFFCPQLPPSPRLAMREVLDQLAPGPQDVLIGSSLGGFYATWLAQQTGCRAALLNPAVRPWTRLQAHIGVQAMWHSDERFEFRAEYVQELLAFEVQRITRAERYLLVAAKGDELLDWREMVAHYPGAALCLIEGSDHGLSDFAEHAPAVLRFAGLDDSSLKPIH
jgi:uncharacterized protein